MSRYPARCRQRPAWRTALATERWIEGRVSVLFAGSSVL